MRKPDFHKFWQDLTPEEKRGFAENCGCHYNYLSAFSAGRQIPSRRLAETMREMANGKLDKVDLRPKFLLKQLRIRQTK